MILPVIFALFLIFTLSLLCYYFCFFRQLLLYKAGKKNSDSEPLSVIICAKDEAENLKEFLPKIYAQNYPDFEVVLIDDRSIDNTFDVIQNFKEQYPQQTKIVNVNISDDNRLRGNKKYALTLGIKAATHDRLVFTDADCQPASTNWLQKTAQNFTDKKQLVLGYGKYRKQKGFLNKLIRFETVQTALQYLSYALKGLPYMGVGRNLAYTKNLFMSNNGFYTHLDILSGDDDLFVNEVATSENTAVCLDSEAFTVSKPKQNWSSYLYQKRRHITTAGHYKHVHRLLLAWYFISLAGFWVTAGILLGYKYLWWYVLGIIFVRLAIAWYINYKVNLRLEEKDLTYWYPMLEIFLIFLQLYIFVANLFKKPDIWTK